MLYIIEKVIFDPRWYAEADECVHGCTPVLRTQGNPLHADCTSMS